VPGSGPGTGDARGEHAYEPDRLGPRRRNPLRRSAPQNSKNPKSVSQYHVACFQFCRPSRHEWHDRGGSGRRSRRRPRAGRVGVRLGRAARGRHGRGAACGDV